VIELWGGLECTVNRVHDRRFDQLAMTGHDDRHDDVDAIAALGIRCMRYPVLWERVVPDLSATPDWRRTDRTLRRMADLGVAPIVGLLHHGSGPKGTSLIHADFAERLADFAGATARRYPWVTAWTPVNEPMVTARFSGLYGHWYPHAKDDRAFVTMVLTQCRAIVLSMQAIRAVTPGSRLVQTEDAGTVYATPTLAYQAAHENARRDLAIDLLRGLVDDTHTLRTYLDAHGASPIAVDWFRAHTCTPDVHGLDYYVTSDRFLDHRVDRYDATHRGTNGQHVYADVAAAGHLAEWTVGFERVLSAAHQRHQLPVALTEVQLACTREEQLRWLRAAWNGAHAAARGGADVRAVTAWALLGAVDWDSLVTTSRGRYEAGAFDVRSGTRRPTAVAAAIRSLARERHIPHPVSQGDGWWTRSAHDPRPRRTPRRPVVVFGATGTLGYAFVRQCAARGLAVESIARAIVDVTNPVEINRIVRLHRPWLVVNATGYVDVDRAEREPDVCRAVNTIGARDVARACAATGARLVSFSSDLVFDGSQSTPYLEAHAPSPLNVYGRSKQQGEELIGGVLPEALIVRTSAFFGPWDTANFAHTVLERLRCSQPVFVDRAVITPTYVPALVDAALDLAIDGACGIWHLAHPDAVSWMSFACQLAETAGLNPELVRERVRPAAYAAQRPRYSALGSTYGSPLGSLENSVARWFADRSRV
jgi:dTDP-4-dehydrorhamnose reductase